MKLVTWIFPESSGTIPGIPGLFPGGSKVVIDEETNSIYSFGPIAASAETSGIVKMPESQEVVTPGSKKSSTEKLSDK